MKVTIAMLLERIEALEAEVEALKSRKVMRRTPSIRCRNGGNEHFHASVTEVRECCGL